MAPEGQNSSSCPFASVKADSSRAQGIDELKRRLVQQPGHGPLSPPSLDNAPLPRDQGRPFIERNVSNIFNGADELALPKALAPLNALLGAGMFLAGLLCTVLPAYVTVALAACLVLPPLIRTTLRASAILPVPGAADIRRGAMTDSMEGEFCVFILGARSNTAFPNMGFKTVGDNFVQIIKELERLPAECGYLGGDNYVTTNVQRSSHITAITYWRSYDHMLRYTHDSALAHTSAMKSVTESVYKSPDVGIWHEAYVVKPGQHESVYINCPPIGLGAVAGLVPATGPNRTSRGRMGARVARASEASAVKA